MDSDDWTLVCMVATVIVGVAVIIWVTMPGDSKGGDLKRACLIGKHNALSGVLKEVVMAQQHRELCSNDNCTEYFTAVLHRQIEIAEWVAAINCTENGVEDFGVMFEGGEDNAKETGE